MTILLVTLALAQMAFCQPSARPVISLESKVDGSALIFIGRITDVQESRERGTVSTVVIDELIRGSESKSSLSLNLWKPVAQLNYWKNQGIKLLFLMNDEGVSAREVIEFSSQAAKAPLANFTFLKGGPAILKFVKDRVRRNPKVDLRRFVIPLLKGDAGSEWHQELVDSGDDGNMLSGLSVPIDVHLEKWAQTNIAAEDIQLASHAIAALSHFKSAVNTELVKAQLRSTLFDGHYDSENNGYQVRSYRIRRQAHEILVKWGLEIDAPIFEELVPVFDVMEELYWQGPVDREKLAVLLKFKNLTVLHFNAPKIGFAEANRISQVKTLVVLSLANSDATDDALEPLTSLPRLAKLELANLPVSDEGLKHVAKIESLRDLWVAGTEITPEGLAWLAEKRPDIKVGGAEYLNPALRYAMRNDVEGLKRIASRDPKALFVADAQDNTALHMAAQYRAYQAAQYLIEQGADVNAINKEGMNPLVRAASISYGDGSVMRLLVQSGVDVDRPDSRGWTALQYRALHGSAFEVRYLINSGADPDRINSEWLESIRNRPEIAELFQNHRAEMEGLPTLLPLVKGEARNQVFNLMVGSTEKLSTTALGAFVGDLTWSETPEKRPFLGPLGQQTASLKLEGLSAHQIVTVELELFLIGSWDGNGDGQGPDIMRIEVPGLGVLLNSTFYNNATKGTRFQSYPDPYRRGFHEGYTGAAEAGTLAFPGDNRDSVYRFSFTFAHTGSDFSLEIKGLTVPQGGLGGLLYDERWGISKLTVKTD